METGLVRDDDRGDGNPHADLADLRGFVSPAPAPLETRAAWARVVLARACAEPSPDASSETSASALAALAAANAVWDAAPARHAEVLGAGSVAEAFADAVAGASAAVARRFAAKLHATPPGAFSSPGSASGVPNALMSFHAAGAGICVAPLGSRPTATRLTAMTHVIAARHARATAVAASAETVAAGALAAAAYAGSGRAEAAAESSRRAERAVAASLRRARDAVVGLRALFARGAADQGHASSADHIALYAQPQDDPPLVGAVVALTHALWERGPPRAPTEKARDAAADAFFEDAFVRSRGDGTGTGTGPVVDGGVSLASFAHSAIFRRALARCVPNRVLMDETGGGSATDATASARGRSGNANGGFLMNGATHGGHMYPPGAVAAALGTIRASSEGC